MDIIVGLIGFILVYAGLIYVNTLMFEPIIAGSKKIDSDTIFWASVFFGFMVFSMASVLWIIAIYRHGFKYDKIKQYFKSLNL